MKNKTYHTCTYDYAHITGYKPWCSVDTDVNNNHNRGRTKDANGTTKKFWGVCDDTNSCIIPPRCK